MQMFKRILKMVAIALAAFVGAVGIGVAVYAIGGGFKDEKIDILKLYVANESNDSNMNKEEIYTLSDVTRTIMCEPADATNKTLEVIVSDPLVASDTEYTGGILKNPPKEIVAGEEFKLEINKDSNGNNIGGVVTVTIRPKGAVGITDVTLKVIVDTAIPNQSIYFTNDINDNFTTSGKNIIMAQSSHAQNIYLRSNLVNAFSLEVADKTTISNLKNVSFNYRYFDVNNIAIDEGVINDAKLDKVFDENLKLYNYFYKVPLVLNKPGHVSVTAKMHKTYAMEKDYIAGDFDNMIIPTNTSSDELKQQAAAKLKAYNDFLNKYKDFIDTTPESNDFFRNTLELVPGESTPKIVLEYNEISESKKHIFQTTSFTINITTVNLKTLSSTSEANTYKVLSTHRYTIDQLKDTFTLSPTLAGEDGKEVDNIPEAELNTLFDTLKVTPYVYVELETYKSNPDLWVDYKEVMGVVGFTNNKPNVTPLSLSEIDGFDGKGILIKLAKDNNDYKDYITITPSSDSASKYWDISFNIPMINDEKSYNETLRALFLQFEVTGLDLNTLQPVIANTYSRVFIDYTDYEFVNNLDRLTFLNSFSRMAINTDLNYTQGIYSDSKANEQGINLNLSNLIANYDNVEYKRVMYFVEQTSNIENGYSKVLTMGQYKFKTMQGTPLKVTVENDGGGSEEIDLIGERLLFNGTFNDPNYFIHAINASTTPIKVFAIVYLSDAEGNPIDLNGRKIAINEQNAAADPTEIVVFEITDITSNENIYIDSFVSNLNYYTYTKVDESIGCESCSEKSIQYQVAAGDLIKRNHLTTYSTEEGAFDNVCQEELMEFLKLKLLADNMMELYVTNFELDGGGAKTDIDEIYIPIFAIKDFYGNELKDENGFTYKPAFNVNTLNNKQIAFNRFCAEYNASNYDLEGFPDHKHKVVYENDGEGDPIYIQLKLRADKKIGDSIRIKAKENVINDLKDNDYVNWQVTSLEVKEVILSDEVKSNYKLYVRSAVDTSKNFDFVETVIDGSRKFTDYTLPLEDGDIPYTIITNLYSNGALDMSVVDPSQADFGSGAPVEEGGELFVYPDISSYINDYCDNNTEAISYLTCDAVIRLKDDLVFKSLGVELDGNSYIYVGKNKFKIEAGNNVININGQNYTLGQNVVDGSSELTISAGEYFPVVNNSEATVAIILGEEVEIAYFENEDVYKVYNNYDGMDVDRIRLAFEVELEEYNQSGYSAHDYIYDGSKDNSDTLSAIVKGQNSATINFIKGGVVKDIYERDDNGFYGKDESTGEYFEVDDSYKGERYAKRGIQTFLMITFDGDVFAKPITKVITYELVQENIEIVSKNGDGSINSDKNPMIVNAGTDNKISLATSGENSINISSPLDRKLFFDHVNYTISEGGVYFKHKSDSTVKSKTITPSTHKDYVSNGGFTLSVPDTYYSGGTFTITLEYSWIDDSGEITTQTKRIYFKIERNYEFDINATENQDGALSGVNDSNSYYLSLESDKSYNLSETISKYFTVGDGTTISYEVYNYVGGDSIYNDQSSKFAKIDNGVLSIGTSYGTVVRDAEGNLTSINLDRFVLRIKLTKQDGSSIYVEKPIVINITPDYVIDLTTINLSTSTNPESILNGESIYDYDYVRLYNYKNISELGSLVTDKTKYTDIFEITNDLGSTTYTDGVIFSQNLVVLQKHNLIISYTESSDATNIISVPFVLQLHAYNLGYAESGDKDYKYKQQVNTAFSIYVPKNGTFDMSDFFNVTSDGVIAGKHNLYMVLVDGSNNIYQTKNVGELLGADLSKTFKLYIANFDGNAYTPIIRWGSEEVTITNVNLFYSIEGLFTSENSTWNAIKDSNDNILNGNVVISGAEGDIIDVTKYYKFFDANGTAIEVLFKNSSGQTDTLTIGSEDVTYNVCYKINNVVYDSGYDVTLKETVSA